MPYAQCRMPVHVDSLGAYNGGVANRKNVKCLKCPTLRFFASFYSRQGYYYLLSWSLLWDRVTLQLDHFVESLKLDGLDVC
jgi:hypothetical protein